MTALGTRAIGRSGVALSEITLGTWGLSAHTYGRVPEAQFRGAIEAAIDAGVTTFDMAPTWGDGASESIVGDATRSVRSQVRYITRAGGESAWDAASLTRSARASLERLGAETLDVLLLHNPDDAVLRAQEFRTAVDTLKAGGEVLAFGASVGTAEQARLALAAGLDVICLPYNLFWGRDVHDVVSDIEAANAGLLVRSPLAYGLLSGTWAASRKFPRGDHRQNRWRETALSIRVKQTAALRFLVRDEIPSLAHAALRFVLSNRLVTSALVGARSAAQIRDAADAARAGAPYLDDADLTRLSQTLSALGVEV